MNDKYLRIVVVIFLILSLCSLFVVGMNSDPADTSNWWSVSDPNTLVDREPIQEYMSNNPKCSECDQPMTAVDEPVVSGVTGYFCMNKECPYDS